jgi:hypothetical protein
MQYVGERPVDVLTLHVYPGDAGAETAPLLYEDDGYTWAFRDDDFRLTRFALSIDGTPPSRLDLHRRTKGRYESDCRGFEIIVHGTSALPHAATTDGQPVGQCKINDDGHAVCLHTGLFEHLAIEWA